MSPAAFLGELVRLAVPVMAATALVGAMAVWTARGRGHWFLRASALVGLVALSLLVFPPQGMLGLAVEALVVVAGLNATRAARAWLRSRLETPSEPDEQGRYQFSLGDLLLAVVVVAMAAGLLSMLPQETWADATWIAGIGTLFGGFALLTVWNPHKQRKPPWVPPERLVRWLFVSGLTGFAIAAAVGSLGARWSEAPAGLIGNVSFLVLVVALCGYLARRKRRKRESAGGDASEPPKPPTPRRRALQIASTLLSMSLVSLYLSAIAGLYLASLPTTKRPPRLPAAPGYTALANAAGLCAGNPNFDVWQATPGQLAAFVQQNARPVATARQALEQECYVSLQYRQADLNRNLNGFRDLAVAMVAEARLADIGGRSDEAVAGYLDVIRLGRAISREGVGIDAVYGWSAEGRAITGLGQAGDRLTADQIRRLLARLQRLDAEREPFERVYHRELAWDEHASGTAVRMLTHMADWNLMESSWDGILLTGMCCQAKMRILICELAVRLYTLEHGREPESLDELVPDCLPELPPDPYTGKPLGYRRDEAGHVIYSVGPDKKDDDGQPITNGAGDVLLDRP